MVVLGGPETGVLWLSADLVQWPRIPVPDPVTDVRLTAVDQIRWLTLNARISGSRYLYRSLTLLNKLFSRILSPKGPVSDVT